MTHIVCAHADSSGAGARWWASDDLGFTGCSDRIDELVEWIQEWARDEGIDQDDPLAQLAPPSDEPLQPEFDVRLPSPYGDQRPRISGTPGVRINSLQYA